MIGYADDLVQQGHFDRVDKATMVPGHSKFAPDALLGVVSRTIKKYIHEKQVTWLPLRNT